MMTTFECDDSPNISEFASNGLDTNIQQFIRYHIEDDDSHLQKLDTLEIENHFVEIKNSNISRVSSFQPFKRSIFESKQQSPRMSKIFQKTYSSVDMTTFTSIDKGHKKLPQEAMKFKAHLTYLNLAKNLLEYVPIEVIYFKNLRVLKLDQNKIRSLPNEMFNLENIEVLSLSYNLLQLIPASLSKFSKTLKELNLSGNLIEKFGKEITDLSNLRILNISHNKLVEFPTSFKNLTNLTEFTFEWFRYTNPVMNQRQCLYGKDNDQGLKKLKHICTQFDSKSFGSTRTTTSLTFLDFVYQLSIIYPNLLQKDVRNRSLLHLSSENEDLSVMHFLMKTYPSLIDQADDNHHTPLSTSILQEKNIAARFLLLHGANPLAGGGSFGSPLHIAVDKMNVSLVRTIAKLGQSVNLTDPDGNTPLHIAMGKTTLEHQKCLEIVGTLLEYGANPNLKNKENWNPLHLTTRKRDHILINWIINYNKSRKVLGDSYELFNLNKRGGQYRWTPLHIASYTESPAVVMALVEAGVDIFKRSANGFTAKKLVGSGCVTLKLLEKYELCWVKKHIIFKREKSTEASPAPSILNGNLKIYSKTDSASKNRFYSAGINTDISPNASRRFSRPESNTNYNTQNKIFLQVPLQPLYRTNSYLNSKHFEDSVEICPESEWDIEIPETDTDFIEDRDHGIGDEGKLKSGLHEKNIMAKKLQGQPPMDEGNATVPLETLHCDAENYDDFLKEEFRYNYHTYKTETNSLKEKLLSETTIFAEKLKLFGMLKILHNRIIEYIYKYCQLDVDRQLYSLLYFRDNLDKNRKLKISRNTLSYMNHYYELVPNTILAVINCMSDGKLENSLLKAQLCYILTEFNYFIGIEALEKIALNKNETYFVREEAKKSASTLKTLLSWHVNRWEEEKLTTISTANTKGNYGFEQDAVGKLLQNQKVIFQPNKKMMKKY